MSPKLIVVVWHATPGDVARGLRAVRVGRVTCLLVHDRARTRALPSHHVVMVTFRHSELILWSTSHSLTFTLSVILGISVLSFCSTLV